MKSTISKWLKEPLVRFLIIGAAIFAVNAWVTNSDDNAQPKIEVTATDIDRLRTLWQRKWQRLPSTEELQGLIDAEIREEILYREALAMGLDKDDTIVRRRMAQKLEFLTEDLMALNEPTDEELIKYFRENAGKYREQAKLSFTQIYFSGDRRGVKAETDAQQALLNLNALGGSAVEAGLEMGDRFMLDSVYDQLSISDIARWFGRSFADEVEKLPQGSWQGPIKSGYGIHLVYVTSHIPGRLPDYAEVSDAVLRDYQQQKREETNRAFYARLKQRYHISIDKTALEEKQQLSEAQQ
ncbi:peptidylprolyl isomerase [Kaarinaea lacus]